jgi:thiopeptide-type bacteriocin biosynthesis protein
MTRQVSTTGREWLSFHVFLGDSWQLFLVFYFLPALKTEFADCHIKRFFFIQYSEGGRHLRLRFLPAKPASPKLIITWLEELVTRFRQEKNLLFEQCFLQKQRYDRSELYFGETIASVYAELLNEQTSVLALQFFVDPGSRSVLLIKLACALYLILENVAEDQHELRRLAVESHRFAGDALNRLGFLVPPAPDPTLEAQLSAALRQSLPRAAPAMKQHPAVRSIIKLLRRLKRSPQLFEAVGLHALHLFCNKVGISLVDEQYFFSSLVRLTGG